MMTSAWVPPIVTSDPVPLSVGGVTVPAGFLQAAIALGVGALLVEGFGSFDAARDSSTYPFALQSGRILLGAIPEDTLERLRWDELRDTIPGLWEAAEKAEEII